VIIKEENGVRLPVAIRFNVPKILGPKTVDPLTGQERNGQWVNF